MRIYSKKLDNRINEMQEKYFHLVWYARKPLRENTSYWAEKTPEIKKKVLNAMARVEEKFPEEVEELSDFEAGDWAHGFNSGCLAAFRYVQTAIHEGLGTAEEEFPFLDT